MAEPITMTAAAAAAAGAALVGATIVWWNLPSTQKFVQDLRTRIEQSWKAERVKNPTKAESPVWKGAEPYKDGLRRSGDEIWDWDNLHDDIEVYDKRGTHQGTRDPTTGEMIKPPVPGREIKL